MSGDDVSGADRFPTNAMILVCPLSHVRAMVARHEPARVVSLLDPEWAFPDLGPGYVGRHLQLSFHDAHVAAHGQVLPTVEHVRALIAFVHAWERTAPLLIHCRAGIGRSTAAGFIAACCAHPDAAEADVAAALRSAAPLARPNETLVALADQVLHRNGRMSAAIAATGRDLAWIDVAEGVPFCLPLHGRA